MTDEYAAISPVLEKVWQYMTSEGGMPKWQDVDEARKQLASLLAERDALRSALAELVACKSIKERIAVEQACGIPEDDEEVDHLARLMLDYATRQLPAWKAARAALGEQQ